MTKCAVFTDGMVAKDVLLSSNTCVIPHEVLTTSGRVLCVGVYGVNAEGDVVIPTVYAEAGMIRPGADSTGDESYPPAPDVTAQLQKRIESLEKGGTPETGGGVSGEDGGYYTPSVTQPDETTVRMAFTPQQRGDAFRGCRGHQAA